MRHNTFMTTLLVLGLALTLMFGVGCSKKGKGAAGAGTDPYGASLLAPGPDGSSGGIISGTVGMGEAGDTWRPTTEGIMIEELPVIYFDFDSFDIKPSEAQKLDSLAAPYFKANPAAHVQIEGHCDSRGTDEYNMTLGEKRATAVRDYLVYAGCDASKLHVISYGEERPVNMDETEEAYAQNRRVQFLVYFNE